MSSKDAARHLTAAALLALAFAVLAAGCGKKGPPLPPLRYVPAPTKDLAIEQRGTGVILTFDYPKTTPAGVALNGVSTVEVWELARPAPPPAPATPSPAAPAPGATTPTAPATPATPTAPATAPKPPAPGAPGAPVTPGVTPTPAVGAPSVPPPPPSLPGGFPPIDARELEAMAKLKLKLQGPEVAAATFGDKVMITLPLPEPSPAAVTSAAPKTATGAKPETGKPPSTIATTATPPELVHYYAVRTTGPKGDRSAFSNQVALLPKPPPPPPGAVKLTGKAEGIEVAWTDPTPAPPADRKIVGFNVYRRDASAKTFGAPLRAAFPDSRSIVDTTARFGESYIYSVTSIADPNPLLESAIQSEVEIKYFDRFPPPAPTDVVALAEAGRVRVVWRASAAPDLAGYLVYRRIGKAPFRKLTAQPIQDVQYQDATVTPGVTYAYRVTAVDKSGNESAPGEAQTKAQ